MTLRYLVNYIFKADLILFGNIKLILICLSREQDQAVHLQSKYKVVLHHAPLLAQV